jgi:hypothetical protein
MTAAPVRKQRPTNGRDTRFKPKNAGKPVGAKDRRRVLGQAAAAALEGKCWDVLERLLTSPSWRARHEAAKTTLAYALGLPRQTVTLAGGFADLSRELAAALAEARVRRAALDASVPVAGSVAKPAGALALPAAHAMSGPAAPIEAPLAEESPAPTCLSIPIDVRDGTLCASGPDGHSFPRAAEEIDLDLLLTGSRSNVAVEIPHSTAPEKAGNNQSNE